MPSSPLASRLKQLSTSSAETQPSVECTITETIVDNETGTVLNRHDDLWFDDGSIICRAQDTLFRVHMSQLARRSVYFRDMFSMPRGQSTDAVKLRYSGLRELGVDVDTTPIIRLYDSAEDVGNLLTALYDGPDFGDNGKDDFRKVSGILRLSSKYMIDSLRAKALSHLNMAWPTSLKGWDTREDIARIYEMETGSHFYPHPISVINLAREVDAPSLLPAAFYDISRRPYTQIFEPHEDDPFYQEPETAQNLSIKDLQRLSLGKEAIQQAITSLIQAMGNSQYIRQGQHHTTTTQMPSRRHSPCISAAACRKDFSELVELATQHYLFDRERGCYDPLYVAEELGQLKSAEFSECIACARSLEAWAARERERLWKLIPQWFRLEGSAAWASNERGKTGRLS
ncbi:hypothetical protein AX15_002182 [Amanita polypyramis BW_CC]|nr:hypothetical protein AX15_002182 [Amanita polypyramis BW_CC]